MIWGHAAPAVLNPLQTLMNRAIRIMTYAPFGNVDLNPVYKELKLLQVSNRGATVVVTFKKLGCNNFLGGHRS